MLRINRENSFKNLALSNFALREIQAEKNERFVRRLKE
jgi:hypothetical protein